MGFIKADRSQLNLLGYSISEFASTDKKIRFIVDIVSRLDLSSLFARYSDQGGDSYAPDMMLTLWFYAYSQGETRSRKLEELCHYDTRYIYLSCNLKPDHTTLSRFRKAHLDLISEYFVQIVLIAEEEGITDLTHIAIDGTKIKAASSAKQSYKEDALDRKINSIRRDIASYMQRCALVEQGSSDEENLETLKEEKQHLESIEQNLVKRKNQLKERQKTVKTEYRKNHRINLVEPDARSMNKLDGPGYNAQLAVDSKSNIIIANETNDQPHDRYQFSDMHQKAEKNLPPDSSRAYTADAGYHSLDQLEYIEDNQVNGLIADQKPHHRSTKTEATSIATIQKEKRKVERSDFLYHEKEDYYECPAGDKLYPKSKRKNYVTYRARACAECPISIYCLSKKSKRKLLYRDPREKLAEKMFHKLETNQAKQKMKMRATSVEPVFGNIKQNLGFRRFNLRDLNQVKGEFNLMCIAHNLNTMFKLIGNRRLAAFIYVYRSKINQHIAISKIRAAISLKYWRQINILTFRRKYAFV
jgi:transposase